MTTLAAEELTQRSKPAPRQGGGLSDRGVRTMSIYASTLIPDRIKGPDGKMVDVDKSDPAKFLIPMDTARRVIQAATRSAYADVCDLPELGKANFKTMLAAEQGKQNWTQEQIVMIETLHLFATSFFAGKAAVPIERDSAPSDWQDKVVEEGDGPAQKLVLPPAPECPPERKAQVEAAINAYVASAGAQ
ncbi:hypothetical protein GL4_1696 [Methyloceanibacter caenitepidi]|uniref:Uncharacterized protein n=2 Tax=Methyloceanibacter caenitepidi TaxID=1384459 RepID=A0A0A8K2K6_9HYPH|nr:hypothetical protein GL4_1696 [Methyloceanibacter caenitepidi]